MIKPASWFCFYGGLFLVFALQGLIVGAGAWAGAFIGLLPAMLFDYLGIGLSGDESFIYFCIWGIGFAIIAFIYTLWMPVSYWKAFKKYRYWSE